MSNILPRMNEDSLSLKRVDYGRHSFVQQRCHSTYKARCGSPWTVVVLLLSFFSVAFWFRRPLNSDGKLCLGHESGQSHHLEQVVRQYNLTTGARWLNLGMLFNSSVS